MTDRERAIKALNELHGIVTGDVTWFEHEIAPIEQALAQVRAECRQQAPKPITVGDVLREWYAQDCSVNTSRTCIPTIMLNRLAHAEAKRRNRMGDRWRPAEMIELEYGKVITEY